MLVWGMVNGLVMILERITAPFRAWVRDLLGISRVPWLQALIQWICTLMLWDFTLLFFRTPSPSDAIYVLTHLHQGWGPLFSPTLLAGFLSRVHLDNGLFLYCLLLIPLTEIVEFCFRTERIRAWMAQNVPAPGRWTLDWLLVAAILVLGHFGDVPFVYFQF
jgi:hypothetical protein